VSTNVNVIPPATRRTIVSTSNNVPPPVGPVGPGSVDGAPGSDAPPPPSTHPPGLKTIVSGGVLNGKAYVLPKPIYPAPARAAHSEGLVTVQVTVDEEGNVSSADAVSGPVLLRAAAIQAARGAKFTPTKLSGFPVKVTGTLLYNFNLQ
jgi:protein TonB